MRKVTDRIVKSLLAGKPDKIGNSSTDGTILLLHGNMIARKKEDGTIEATLAGWPTVTTRERLNGLCQLVGLNRLFYQSKNMQYFGDESISPYDWVVLVPKN